MLQLQPELQTMNALTCGWSMDAQKLAETSRQELGWELLHTLFSPSAGLQGINELAEVVR